MTSELLIMNSSAVALAADSVVTVDNRKTYTGVNKLFMLSNNPPMGIMTYNLATFLGIPLETIIKEFRKEISEKDIHSICEFKDEFEKFLNGVVSKSNNQKSFTDYMNLFINIARNDYERLSVNEFKNIIHESANNWDNANLNHFNDEILGLLNENIEYFKDYLIEINMYSDDFLNIFKKCFMNYLFLNNNESVGIVIAGFEHEKMFPSSIDFKINYLYDDKFILRELNKVDIKVNDCLVKPFAQVDVINTFLYSVDSEFENEIINFVNGVKLNYINHIKKIISFIENNDNVPDDIKNQLLSDILNLEVENEDLDILKKLNNLKINHYLPIVKSIASLPKEDLSNLAESLIKITSLKRKHQNDLQTVGGPVDVAIITKGDGFIWTKRKHYFDANLNPQFFDMK